MNNNDILLDVSRLIWRQWDGRPPTGIDRTCLAYAQHYRARARAVVQRDGMTHVLNEGHSRQLFDLLLEPGDHFRRDFVALAARMALTFGHRVNTADRLYLNVGHTGLNMPGHSRWLRRSGVRPVYFVHDLIPLTHPEHCRQGEPEKHVLRLRALLEGGHGVIGNSADTLKELSRHAFARHLPMPPTLVAPLGVEPTISTGQGASESPLGRPYFLMLGTIEGRKNHLLILNIWKRLIEAQGRAAPQLVIVGRRGWESEQVVDMLDRCEVLHGHVIELPMCSDSRLADYMRHARALLFPSFVEGYGLPLVEALASGTPVIASDLGVFREMASDIPLYISPIDGIGWQNAVIDYAAPDSLSRADQLARMRRYRAPRWSDHFDAVDAWINASILSRSGSHHGSRAAAGHRDAARGGDVLSGGPHGARGS
ncbi:MAG: glycosyltransferase family 4 protein [Sphingobium sp.]